MPTAIQAPTSLLSVAGFRKFTPAQYHKLLDFGILYEGEPIELLEGYLVEKGMKNPPHDGAITRLGSRLPRKLPTGWITRIQCATALGESEPEPDGAVVRGDDTSYDRRLPTPADFGLVIEVSDSTLAFDRTDKARIYARAAIPVYWIINIPDQQIEAYSQPNPMANPPAYAVRSIYNLSDSVPLVLDGSFVTMVPAADFLP